MNWYKPLFFRGRGNPQTPTSTYSDGDNIFTLVDADQKYSVGEHVLAEIASDQTLPEYLGKVTAVTSSALTVQRGLSRGYSSDSIRLFSPTNFWFPTYGVQISFGFDPDYGVITERTAGGQVTATKVADRIDRISMLATPVIAAEYELWQTFLLTFLDSGLDTMAVAFWDHTLNRSRVIEVRLNMGNNSVVPVRGLRREYIAFGIEYFILNEDTVAGA